MPVLTAAEAAPPIGDQPPADGEPTEGRQGLLRQILLTFMVLLAIFAVSYNTDDGDGFLALPAAHSLLHDGDLDLAEYSNTGWFDTQYGVVEVEGRAVDYFPWTTAAAAVPLVLLWDAASAIGLVGDIDPLIRAGMTGQIRMLFASVICAWAAVVLGLLTRRLSRMITRPPGRYREWLDPDSSWALPVWTLTLGLGTSLWSTASRSLWQHGPAVLTAGSAVLCMAHLVGCNPVRRHVGLLASAAGILLALSYWTRPTNALIGLFVVAVVALRRRNALLPLLGATAAVHAVMIVLNRVLVGRSLPPYYQASRLGWHADLPEAVAANLISPARGLIVFSPFLLAAPLLLARTRRELLDDDTRVVVVGGLLTSGAYLLAVSAFTEKWWAGHSVGPRFMTEALVMLGPMALVAIFGPREALDPRRFGRIGWLSAIVLSVLLHLGAANSRDALCWNKVPANVDSHPERVWSWTDAQVFESARSTARGWTASGPGRCAAIEQPSGEQRSDESVVDRAGE